MGSNIIKAFLISNSELDPQVTFIIEYPFSKKRKGDSLYK
jgi:hypothetical protein